MKSIEAPKYLKYTYVKIKKYYPDSSIYRIKIIEYDFTIGWLYHLEALNTRNIGISIYEQDELELA